MDNLHVNQQRYLQEHLDGPQELYEFSANALSRERKGMLMGFINIGRIPLIRQAIIKVFLFHQRMHYICVVVH